MQIVLSSADPICPVGYINFTKLKHAPKTSPIKYKIKTSKDFVPIDYTDNLDVCPTNDTKESNCALYDIENTRDNMESLVFIQNKPQTALNRKGWLFLTGIQCTSPDPSVAVKEGLSQIGKMLTLKQFSLRDLLNVVLYIKDMNSFGTINAAYINIINFQSPPTRVCVECELPINCTIIMEAVAFKSNTINTDDFSKKTVLHVQGISHWAPANIGPYSQSIKVFFFLWTFTFLV